MVSSTKVLISLQDILTGRPRGHDPALSVHSMPCFDKPEKRAAAGVAICANSLKAMTGRVNRTDYPPTIQIS
jgi:hypothetical protein